VAGARLLDEKVEALVRSLPKNLRVHFVPVPDAVARALPRIERGRGSLHAQLGDALWHTGGVQYHAMPSAKICCRRTCA
jgi:ATP-dependent helicase HrpA